MMDIDHVDSSQDGEPLSESAFGDGIESKPVISL